MDSEVDENITSCKRDSVFYDDVASEGDLSKESVTASVDKEAGKESQKEDASCDTKAVDEGSPEDKRRLRKEGDDKELWTPVKSDAGSNISDEAKMGDEPIGNSPDDHPTKPPRRHSQKKVEVKEQSGEASGEEQNTSSGRSSGGDPAKPPRRRLSQLPKPGVTEKPDISEKSDAEVDSATGDDQLSGLGDHSEQKPREIVCKPVLTSSPNQDEIPNLSVEMVDTLDASRRVLSYVDVSSSGGSGSKKRVESFYDFLYSGDDVNSVANVTSPISQDGNKVGSALSCSEDRLYDDVPMEDSIAESFSQKSNSGSTYEEVIVNQGNRDKKKKELQSHLDHSWPKWLVGPLLTLTNFCFKIKNFQLTLKNFALVQAKLLRNIVLGLANFWGYT